MKEQTAGVRGMWWIWFCSTRNTEFLLFLKSSSLFQFLISWLPITLWDLLQLLTLTLDPLLL